MPILLDLFLTFAKIGAFTFGGGYAMLSIITDNCVERKKWITAEDMMNITVIAETTPGPVAINCATFVGFRTAGLWGAICATLGVVLPSFLIIYIISMFLDGFLEIRLVANAFRGIKIAVGVLILQAGFKLRKTVERKPLPIALLVGCLGLMLAVNIFSWKVSTILVMLVCAAIGVTVHACGKAGAK